MVSSLSRVFFSCAAVATAARVKEENNAESQEILYAEALIKAEVDDLIERVGRTSIETAAAAEETGPDTGTLTLALMTRQCVQEQAENYPGLMAKHGLATREMDGDRLLNDVLEFWTIRDLRTNHLSSYNMITGAFARMTSPEIRAFREQLQNVSSRFEEYGFDYAGAETRCGEDGTSLARRCIIEKTEQFATESLTSGLAALAPIRRQLPTLVSTRIELRDLQVHEPPAFDQSEFDILTETIAAIGFDLPAAQRECVALSRQHSTDVLLHLRQEVQSPAPSIDNCNEDPNGLFCPEGTGLMVSRPTETIRGTAAFSTVYFAAWPALNFIAPAITTILGFGPGPGLFFANGPFPHGAIFGSLSYAIFSTGARQCMCFPEECYYNAETASCGLRAAGGMAASNNPFTNRLPFRSTKCVLSTRREETCEMKACAEPDYATPLGEFEGANFFGTLGQHDDGLYNCISDTGSSSDTLLIKTELPGSGLPNLPENRNRILEALM